MKPIKYSRYLQETTRRYHYLPFHRLDLPPGRKRERLATSPAQALTIVTPYVKVRLREQFRVVVPIALYLLLFQLVIMKQEVAGGLSIALGLTGVILGLMFFMEGLKVGLMPFGEAIGNSLPVKAKREEVLIIAFTLGVGATFAEPAMGVLKEAGRIVDPAGSPLLHAMLNRYAGYTVTAVAIGVGIATLLGVLMFIKGWSLKRLIYCSLIPTLGLTAYAFSRPELAQVIGLAWDCGAVTTGPVTVPLVLSLGIGVAGSIKHKHTRNIPGFGLVTLASLYPIMAVLILAVLLDTLVPAAGAVATAEAAGGAVAPPAPAAWFGAPFAESVLLALRAIVPLALFLFLVQRYLLQERIHRPAIILYGLVLCFIGMSLFNLGLSFGLSPLGNQVGAVVPAAYAAIETVFGSPLYGFYLGLLICVLFAFCMGYGATLAEPALNALGMTVENLTNGAFRKKLVMVAVSGGVALGLVLGVLKIVFSLPIIWLLLPLYFLALLLTAFSEEKYVNIGWDSAGVTTGPITVPLVLAMGLGFAVAAKAGDGFGILALASVCPILSVLTFGLYVRAMQAKTAREEEHHA